MQSGFLRQVFRASHVGGPALLPGGGRMPVCDPAIGPPACLRDPVIGTAQFDLTNLQIKDVTS